LVERALLFEPSRHSSSELCGSLPLLASEKPAAATATDPDGQEVVLLARI
jgi:hypothetical protein